MYVNNKAGEAVPLLFTYPTSADSRIAAHLHMQALKEAEEAGIPSISEMEIAVRERGIFTEEDEASIERLTSKLEGQRVVLSKTTKVPARRERLEKIIAGLKEQINEIKLKREITFDNTRERKAAEEKFLYLTWCGTKDPFTGERFWKTWEDFQAETDYHFRKRVLLDYIVFAHGIDQSSIRFIARSNLWRLRYVSALKTGDELFGRAIRDYTVDQLMVLYWSHYYQSIYEMMPDDRPPDSIIVDDEALDAYMKDWQEDRSRDAAASRAKKNKKYGQSTAWDYDETLVMRSNPMHEDIEYSQTLAENKKY